MAETLYFPALVMYAVQVSDSLLLDHDSIQPVFPGPRSMGLIPPRRTASVPINIVGSSVRMLALRIAVLSICSRAIWRADGRVNGTSNRAVKAMRQQRYIDL